MDFASICFTCNTYLALPSTIIFLFVAIILTIKTKFMQFKGWHRFIHLLKFGAQEKSHNTYKSIGSLQALFTAMSTTIGIGNIVGPSLAIAAGGPGAIFWLIVYSFLGSVTKFVEVTLAVSTRKKTEEGVIIGGPNIYLNKLHSNLGIWYSLMTIPLFAGWSAIQSNILADILSQESFPRWLTGILLGCLVFLALLGGVKRISNWATKLVPLMFVLYVSFSFFILIKHAFILPSIFKLILNCAFSPTAALGGFLGASIFESVRHGIYKGIYITESGIGTSAIPHALANVEHPTDQGLLAMYSVFADTILCFISGLLVLVTGSWWQKDINNIIVYETFKKFAPKIGQIILLVSIILFVFTTIIGNAFNGNQSFGSLTKYRYLKTYALIVSLVTFLGAILELPIIWNLCDILLVLIAVPNCLGILLIYFKDKSLFIIKK